jgi:glycosyltransferase involved in cell wall biosynthesis
MKKKVVVFHLLPVMQIGGVETAIFKSYDELNKSIDYQVYTIFSRNSFEFETKSIWTFFLNVLIKKPDLVITSLWLCHPIGWICNLFNIQWVPFFHNASYSHFRDKISLILSSMLSKIYFADSESTAKFMRGNDSKVIHIVPYIFNERRQVDYFNKDIDFIWIGRNNIQKRLDLLERFLSDIIPNFKNLKIKILIGGTNNHILEKFVGFLENCDVEIIYNAPNVKVRQLLDRAKVYLLFSDYEGMSMTTIEAIQSYCFPLVRPVGEIPYYLNSDGAIFFEQIVSFKEYYSRVKEILENDKLRLEYCIQNKSKIDKRGGYIEAILAAIEKSKRK